MRKILILDDNHDILESLSIALLRRGLEVIMLAEPYMLNQYLLKHNPDLLLMDIALGCYDGRDICRQIKVNIDRCRIPVILFTAQCYSSRSIDECYADAVLQKPFPLQQLYYTIDKLLPAHT